MKGSSIPRPFIEGFYIGQAQDLQAATGCTVVINKTGAVCGVDVRGGSPGTRDTDALNPKANRKVVHAVLLAGGSSFGLDAAGGVMRFLEQHNIGRDAGVTCVPNVSAAILFDLKCGACNVRPDAAMGYAACENAFTNGAFKSGCYGAGTGATIGKTRGAGFAMKGGIGFASFSAGDLEVAAVSAVNCVGDILENGKIIAGALDDDGTFANSEKIILSDYKTEQDFFSGKTSESNTVLVCIMTNAVMGKAAASMLASIGHNGIARCVRPAHSIYDGDTVFAMSSCRVHARFDAAAILASHAVEMSIIDAVKNARSLCGYPAMNKGL
ncbi:peptidase [Spirochaetia bacterium]|nr:peptidase [Spirochaetia bacterium]